MNWTGGRLQQSRRAKGGISAQQKAYFAKAKARLLSGNERRPPLDLSVFGNVVSHQDRRDTSFHGNSRDHGTHSISPVQKLNTLSALRDVDNSNLNVRSAQLEWAQRTDPSLGKQGRPGSPPGKIKLEQEYKTRRRRRHEGSALQVERRPKANYTLAEDEEEDQKNSPQDEESMLEKKRRELLKRKNWLSASMARPLQIRYPRRRDRTKTARRRKLNGDDLLRLRQQRRSRRSHASLNPHSFPHRVDPQQDRVSIRHGTQIHGSQRTQHLPQTPVRPIAALTTVSPGEMLLDSSQGSAFTQKSLVCRPQVGHLHSSPSALVHCNTLIAQQQQLSEYGGMALQPPTYLADKEESYIESQSRKSAISPDYDSHLYQVDPVQEVYAGNDEEPFPPSPPQFQSNENFYSQGMPLLSLSRQFNCSQSPYFSTLAFHEQSTQEPSRHTTYRGDLEIIDGKFSKERDVDRTILDSEQDTELSLPEASSSVGLYPTQRGEASPRLPQLRTGQGESDTSLQFTSNRQAEIQRTGPAEERHYSDSEARVEALSPQSTMEVKESHSKSSCTAATHEPSRAKDQFLGEINDENYRFIFENFASQRPTTWKRQSEAKLSNSSANASSLSYISQVPTCMTNSPVKSMAVHVPSSPQEASSPMRPESSVRFPKQPGVDSVKGQALQSSSGDASAQWPEGRFPIKSSAATKGSHPQIHGNIEADSCDDISASLVAVKGTTARGETGRLRMESEKLIFVKPMRYEGVLLYSRCKEVKGRDWHDIDKESKEGATAARQAHRTRDGHQWTNRNERNKPSTRKRAWCGTQEDEDEIED